MARTAIPVVGGNSKVAEHNFYDFRYAASDRNTGNIWFVDSNGTAGSGLSPEDPKTTLASAVSAATTNNDDVVYIASGHTESFTGAAAATLSKGGMRFVGLGVDRKSTRLNSSHVSESRMPSSA